MVKTREYWTKTITYRIGLEFDFQLRLRIIKGKTEQFSIIFRCKIGNNWHDVRKCDNTKQHNGVPHCHVYSLNRKSRIDFIGGKRDNIGKVIHAIIKDIQKNYQKIVENYKY